MIDLIQIFEFIIINVTKAKKQLESILDLYSQKLKCPKLYDICMCWKTLIKNEYFDNTHMQIDNNKK